MPSPLLVATSISSALALGLVPVLFGSVKTTLRDRLHLTERRLDQLDKLLLLAWVPLMPLAGWLIDQWGLSEILFAGSMILSLAISWLALCQTFVGLLWGVLGLAVAGACITTAGVTLMPDALTLSPRWSAAASLGLGYVFVSLAMLLTPLLVRWLQRQLGFQKAVLSVGLLCLVPAALVALVKGEIPGPGPVPLQEAAVFDLRFWLIALVAFLYFLLERSLAIWPGPYLAELGYTGRNLVRLLVGFWCAFLLFRFGLGWMIRQGNEAWLVLVLLVVSSMVMGNLAGAYAPGSGYLGVWLVGACYGPLLPALLGILLDLEGPRGIRGQAVGIVFALSALSSLMVQPALAAFAKNHTPRAAMRIPMVLGLLMAAPMVVFALLRFGR
jgi:MFS family permease